MVILGLLAGGRVQGQTSWNEPLPTLPSQPGPGGALASPSLGPSGIDLDALPAQVRAKVRTVLEQPTLSAQGPVEVFNCRPAFYRWLLDHPDVTVRLWRRLGARCTDILDLGEGRFGWKDAQGDVHWDTVRCDDKQRVWYAEGTVRPSLWMPAVAIRAVVVLRHTQGHDRKGQPTVRHQMSLAVHTDSKAVALAARLLGASAPHMAEQFVGQVEMFYGALAWYLDQHPEQTAGLFGAIHQPVPAEAPVPQTRNTGTQTDGAEKSGESRE